MLGADLALKELLSQPTPQTASLESSRQHPVPDGADRLRALTFYQEGTGQGFTAARVQRSLLENESLRYWGHWAAGAGGCFRQRDQQGERCESPGAGPLEP